MIISLAAGSVKPTLSKTARPIVQNLGPGTLYFNTNGNDVINTGIKMLPLAVYEFPTTLVEGPGAVWFQAEDDYCDVRILNVG